MSAIESRKLVKAEQLLDLLFEENSKPSLQWLKAQIHTKNPLPHYRIGSFVFYDVMEIRAHLVKQFNDKSHSTP